MYFEVVIFATILVFLLNRAKVIKGKRFFDDNQKYFQKLKEEDWDFYVKAKYGDTIDPDILYQRRLKNSFFTMIVMLIFFVGNLNYINIIVTLVVTAFMFKTDYFNIQGYYKKHLHEIDAMLPHYLKGLEILIQHYTVPVAIGKSIEDAPQIFKDGLREMINRINSGDSSIEPYMEFARTYPVRDSMRMMRLLYRLGLGKQERKQEQLLTFSKTISNLQQKSRDIRYAERLNKMESKTMSMLVATGLGVMILMIIAVLNMMNM